VAKVKNSLKNLIAQKEYDDFLLEFIKAMYEDKENKSIGFSNLKITTRGDRPHKKLFEFRVWVEI